MTYWHGGGAIPDDVILPAVLTGRSRSGASGVHVTTDRKLAEVYASTVNGTAWVYEVEPIGELQPVASTIPGAPTISYRCSSARIIRRFTISTARRNQLRARVADAAHMMPDR